MFACWFIAHSIHVCNIAWIYANSIFSPQKAFIDPCMTLINKNWHAMKHKAPTKRSQHFNATYRNIVGCNLLRAFGHLVATCCNMLGVSNIYGRCMLFWSFGQVRPAMLRLGMRPVATRCNRVAKSVQHVAPNNVANCCVQMLRSFGRRLQMLGQQCWDMLRWDVAIVWAGLKLNYERIRR